MYDVYLIVIIWLFYCFRVSKIIGLVEDKTLSHSVTKALFQHVPNIPIFCNLILSNPATPERPNESMIMCSIMGAILPFLRDAEVFKAACMYSCKLLGLMRNKPEAVLEFCRNIANVRIILKAAVDNDNDLGLTAVKLLKVLLVVQVNLNLLKMYVCLDYSVRLQYRFCFGFIRRGTD